MKTKRYLLYALGEIFLIVMGILLALYINNRNINQQYKSQIDNNIIRVYEELEKNIDLTKATIKMFQYKDSLVHLTMNDSLIADDFYKNMDLAFLVVQNHQESLEEEAYQNLIQLNISNNRYNDDLLIDLKELYFLNKATKGSTKNMANFISDISIPFLAENIPSFSDLFYKEEIKNDALDFFMKSKEYKTFVSRYAILALRIQLDHNKKFYTRALAVYNQISEQYDLKNNHPFQISPSMASKYQGTYANEFINNDLIIKVENDSLFIDDGSGPSNYLVPLKEKRFFVKMQGQMSYFVSFTKNEKDTSELDLKLHFMSNRYLFKKVKK